MLEEKNMEHIIALCKHNDISSVWQAVDLVGILCDSESKRTEFIANHPSILCHKATDTWYEESIYDCDKSEYIYAPSSYDSVIAKLEHFRA